MESEKNLNMVQVLPVAGGSVGPQSPLPVNSASQGWQGRSLALRLLQAGSLGRQSLYGPHSGCQLEAPQCETEIKREIWMAFHFFFRAF